MQVDGSVEGELHVNKTLVLSESGRATGDVYAEHVVINGEFEGTCHATKIEILSNGRVNGAIHSDDLSIEQGGRFNGVTYPSSNKKEDQSVVELVELQEAKMAAES